MRVLLLSSFFYPHYGGSQRYMEELYANLVKRDSSVKVDVICYNTTHAIEAEKYRGLNIYRVPCWEVLQGQFALPNPISMISLIKKLSSKNKYDLIHSNTRFFDHSWYTPILAKILGAKSVLTDHCAYHPIAKSNLVTFVSRLFDEISLAICARSYDVVIATNKATQKFLKTYKFKSPQLIYGGVDSDYFKPASKKQKITISFVGRMIKSKGPDLLVEVAERIVRCFPDVNFIFAGNGELFSELSSKESSKIHFTGALDSKKVANLLAQTDIFVHPSIHPEGFPNVILEAGSCGCAVIATDRGGTKEIVIDNETGLIIEPTVKSIQNALEKLILNQSLRIRLGKSIRSKIEKEFDWKIIASQFHVLVKKQLDFSL